MYEIMSIYDIKMRLKLSKGTKGTNRRGKGKEGKEKRRCEKEHARLTIFVQKLEKT